MQIVKKMILPFAAIFFFSNTNSLCAAQERKIEAEINDTNFIHYFDEYEKTRLIFLSDEDKLSCQRMFANARVVNAAVRHITQYLGLLLHPALLDELEIINYQVMVTTQLALEEDESKDFGNKDKIRQHEKRVDGELKKLIALIKKINQCSPALNGLLNNDEKVKI